MSSNLIEIAQDLSEVMADLRDDLREDLKSAGKRALFEETIQILIVQAKAVQTQKNLKALTQAEAVQSQENLNALVQNIYRLVSKTEELQELLPDDLPDDGQMGVDWVTEVEAKTLEDKYKEYLKVAAGIQQHLVVLVSDVKRPQTDDLQSQFDKRLHKLGVRT